ncbi:MAG TPA: hypothetical protein VMW08_00875 [Acidimicrobiales bacterium]|nr:hypothetical protein [Acidimicrobiales bacterium]
MAATPGNDNYSAGLVLAELADHWAIGEWITDGALTVMPSAQPRYAALSTGEKNIVDIAWAMQQGRWDFPVVKVLELDSGWREIVMAAISARVLA